MKEIQRLMREAYESLYEAWESLREHKLAESINGAIKCMVTSIKAVELASKEVLGGKGNLIEDAMIIVSAMEGIMKLELRRIVRAKLIEALWTNPKVTQICSEGLMGLKPREILSESEARLAVDHASEIYYFADSVVFKILKTGH